MNFCFKAWLLFIALSLPGLAQKIPSDASLIQLSTRTFDLRTDVRNLQRDDHFIPLTEIKWLLELINNDPYLDSTVIHIKVREKPFGDGLFLATNGFTTRDNPFFGRPYEITKDLPADVILDGFETFSVRDVRSGELREFLFFPNGAPYNYYVHCTHKPEIAVLLVEGAGPWSCLLTTTYSADAYIRISVRMYYPNPPFHFRGIATRAREIIHCLDVTDRLDEDGRSPEKPVDPYGDLPILKDCYVEPTS